MELILWRHADAELGQPDGERRLTPKGLKQAARMAEWLAARLPDDYVVMASPAVRAQQPARALSTDVKTVPDFGTASSAKDLIRACGWPRGGTVVAVPFVSMLLVGVVVVGIGGYALYFVMLERLPPATAAALQLLAPPLAAVFGWALLGEALGWLDVLGGVVTLAGLLLLFRARR
jgi:hypothetical protein